MQKYGVNELRRMFLEFFESKGHLAMKSFSLVPHNDKSLLLINSGMAPLKPYFTGQEIPPRRRVTTCQKCIRTGDIENVGKTARHGTFFEMLGNFSFGDYFKNEAIHWTWEFLTEVVGLDPDRLYPSIYQDDDEAFEIWNKEIGIPAERIFRFGKEDNFWEHGAGPCGPCSEVYYDRGEKYGCGQPGCTVGCECDRYMEIWNNVFTQFDNDGHNNYTELEQKNIDTGMGLERLACIVQDVDSMFDIDTLKALRDHVCNMAGVEYQKDDNTDTSIRVLTDHIRSVTFMISDGILPSNSGRGYVLRRLLRRACRHGRLLGVKGAFLVELAQTVIDGSKDGYPELEEKKDFIFNVIAKEEAQFNKTIDQGLSILADMEEEMKKNGETVLSGKNAFKLYDTYGFPLDLTKEILEERGCTVDEDGFAAAMKEQKEKARKARKTTNYMGADVTVYQSIDPSVTTEFIGYDRLTADSRVTVLTTEDELVQALTDGQKGTIIVERTPFYGTMGGQQGDTGVISNENGSFKVEDTIHLQGGKVGHVGVMTKGMFQVGETVTLSVCAHNRALTCKNHSATHLLQKALRKVLGDHVEQAGSYVDAGRLRFDFAHFSAMTPDEIKKVEELVNQEIRASLPVVTQVMTLEEAKKTGAMALFGEKYGDKVRVVRMGDFSTELCGGTHVDNTAKAGPFRVKSETSVASGVRRIEATCGKLSLQGMERSQGVLHKAAQFLKTAPAGLLDRMEQQANEMKQLRQALDKLKAEASLGEAKQFLASAKTVRGLHVITTTRTGMDVAAMRTMGDFLRDKDPGVVAVIASINGEKVSFLAVCGKEAVARGIKAGDLVRSVSAVCGGKGGGKPDSAMGGGTELLKVDDALAAVDDFVSEKIS